MSQQDQEDSQGPSAQPPTFRLLLERSSLQLNQSQFLFDKPCMLTNSSASWGSVRTPPAGI